MNYAHCGDTTLHILAEGVVVKTIFSSSHFWWNKIYEYDYENRLHRVIKNMQYPSDESEIIETTTLNYVTEELFVVEKQINKIEDNSSWIEEKWFIESGVLVKFEKRNCSRTKIDTIHFE